jgi:hypothetical protein
MTNEKYTCSQCGNEHNEWPSLAYKAPDQYATLSTEDKAGIASINSDFCVIKRERQTDRFIRCTMTQKVNDYCEDLDYGLWVSLSEKSYNDYTENFKNEHHHAEYFGWLCNDIQGYAFEKSIPTTVCTRSGNQRPEIVPHSDFEHPFVKDYYSGISKEEAEDRISTMMKQVQLQA